MDSDKFSIGPLAAVFPDSNAHYEDIDYNATDEIIERKSLPRLNDEHEEATYENDISESKTPLITRSHDIAFSDYEDRDFDDAPLNRPFQLLNQNYSEETDSEFMDSSDLGIEKLLAYEDIDKDYKQFEEVETIIGEQIDEKMNLISTFQLPSLSDISEEHEPIVPIPITISETDGRFVSALDHPGSGEDKSTSDYNTLTPEITKSASVGLNDNISDSISDNSSLLLLSTGELDWPELIPLGEKRVEEEVGFVTFKSLVAAIPDEEHETKSPPIRSILQIMTIDFLNELISKTVDHVVAKETISSHYQALDNEKLINALIQAYHNFIAEQEHNHFLNSKMYEYFKRGHNRRVLLVLEPHINLREYQRYVRALRVLDYWINVAAQTKKRCAFLLSSVTMDLSYVMNIVMCSEEHFEKVVLRTLTANRTDSFRCFVERELRHINQKRCEISDARLFLITRKHTLARIADKIQKLEKINHNISMDSFISMQNKVVALVKKIEERNAELRKMRFNYHSELHEIQHNREKAMTLKAKLDNCNIILTEKLIYRDAVRQNIRKLKLKHNWLRKEYSNISYKGGLMDMPALMFDYDETVEKVLQKQAIVSELKETIRRTTQRITDLDSRYI